ncbi:MAG: nitroreductase family protein [Alphaproteobacteria bacterium]|nr:nitroreductase family protein [Alphaproteobacteria bacterium]
MELYQGLLTRRSVRQFDTSKKVSKQDIEDILRAASYAPSAHNKQPWEFLVLEDLSIMDEVKKFQPWTSFAKNASCVIIVCADTDVAFHSNEDNDSWNMSDIDCALATQNLLLACHSKGLGACFCGAAPITPIVDGLRKVFNLPENIRPIAIVPIGYPLETPKQPQDRYIPEKVHYGKW